MQRYVADSCWISLPLESPGPFLQGHFPSSPMGEKIPWLWSGQMASTEIQVLKLLLLHGIILYQLQDLEFLFLEHHQGPLSLFFQLINDPLKAALSSSIQTGFHSQTCWGALCPKAEFINRDNTWHEKVLSQYWSLEISSHEAQLFELPIFHLLHILPIRTKSQQFDYNDATCDCTPGKTTFTTVLSSANRAYNLLKNGHFMTKSRHQSTGRGSVEHVLSVPWLLPSLQRSSMYEISSST